MISLLQLLSMDDYANNYNLALCLAIVHGLYSVRRLSDELILWVLISYW